MLGAVTFAHDQIKPVVDLIISLAEDAAKEPFDFSPPDYSALYDAVKAAGEDKMRAAYAITDKQERTAAVAAAKADIKAALSEEQLVQVLANMSERRQLDAGDSETVEVVEKWSPGERTVEVDGDVIDVDSKDVTDA